VSKTSAACEPSHVLTPSINFTLLLKHFFSKQVLQVGKQVVLARIGIRAVKEGVQTTSRWNSPGVLSASSCMWTRIFMMEHYTGCQHSTPFVLNDPRHFVSVSQYTSDVIVAPCCTNSIISIPFLSQKKLLSAFWQTKVVWTFSSCLMNVWMCMTALWFHLSQLKPRFRHPLLVRCDWESYRHLCGIILDKIKAEATLCVLCAPVSIFGNFLRKNCDSLA
jgi:hypothetical protein